VPETILCRFPEKDIDPNAPFNDERSLTDSMASFPTTPTAISTPERNPQYPAATPGSAASLIVDVELQYNRALCFDPTLAAGSARLRSATDASEVNLYPYVAAAKLHADPSEDGK